jgi:hypothetical protein
MSDITLRQLLEGATVEARSEPNVVGGEWKINIKFMGKTRVAFRISESDWASLQRENKEGTLIPKLVLG